MGIEPDPLEVAARALRHRDRSAREIGDRLARAGVADDVRAETLETLERIGYVDDVRFAAARAASLAARGRGDAAIRHDLEGHGIDADTIETAIASLTPEAERASAIAERHGRTPRTARQLAARGFGEEAVAAALGGHIAAEGAEFL